VSAPILRDEKTENWPWRRKVIYFPRGSRFFAFAVLFSGTILGVLLRVYHLGSQIIGDDEWHGIYYAVNTSFKHIFTNFHIADNCIPLTAFYKLLLETLGLNGLNLHALQLFLGLISLVLFPFIIHLIFKERVAVIFSFFLSISPLLIYYSRYARPYIIVVFLSFLSVFSFYFWIETRRLIYIGIFIITAILAPYFSLFSCVTIAAPLIFTTGLIIAKANFAHKLSPLILPKFKHVFEVGILLIIGIALWFLPTVHSLPVITQKVGKGYINPRTILGLISLFSGAGSDMLSIVFLLFFLYGFYVLFKEKIFWGGYLATIVTLQLLALVIIKPHAIQEPVVLARYSISCLPFWLLSISVAVHDIYKRLSALVKRKTRKLGLISEGFLAAFLLIVFFKGPLVTIYRFPNNFTNHSDFQYSYKHENLKRILEYGKDLFPAFYSSLKMEKKDVAVIEFPFVTFWTGNNYHFYQRFHKKRVLIGYSNFSYISQASPIMSGNIHLKNFIELENRDALKNCKANFVIIHKDMLAEFIHLREILPASKSLIDILRKDETYYVRSFYFEPAKKQVQGITLKLQEALGPPIYEDKWIVVFRII